MTLAAIFACLGWSWVAITMIVVALRVGLLGSDRRGAGLPRLSVIVPACNEADTIVAALGSLLKVEYPDLEIVLINDRSTDGTGDLMESLSRDDPRVRVVHLSELPDGWLGKVHAMHRGAALASGEWLLFTDADVHFAPDSLSRCVSLAERAGVDHLCVGPRMQCVTFWEKVFISFFGTAFCFRYRPDLVSAPGPYHVGVGAFNMVRSDVYRQLGGHSTLALQVIDDMEFGKLVKSRGYRQLFVGAGEAVTVRWAVGLSGLAQVLEKNAYAGLYYSLPYTLLATLVTVFHCIAPLWLLTGPAWGWGLLGLFSMQVCAWAMAPAFGAPRWSGVFYPIAGLVFCAVLWRAAFLVHWRGGIQWRGTFYRLETLRDAAP
jgi:hypothetical protein